MIPIVSLSFVLQIVESIQSNSHLIKVLLGYILNYKTFYNPVLTKTFHNPRNPVLS